MAFNLRNRNFLKLLDFTPQEIKFLLNLSLDLKKAKYAGTEQQLLKGKNIALIFEKDSTRTRCAFEVAAYDQGANEMADQVREFLKEGMLNILGGCCGTTPDHIRALANMAAEFKPRKIEEELEEQESNA